MPVSKRNDIKICDCGSKMVRVMSLPMPAIFKKTGRGMALDSLNNVNTVPDRWYKPQAEQLMAAGLDPIKATIGTGF